MTIHTHFFRQFEQSSLEKRILFKTNPDAPSSAPEGYTPEQLKTEISDLVDRVTEVNRNNDASEAWEKDRARQIQGFLQTQIPNIIAKTESISPAQRDAIVMGKLGQLISLLNGLKTKATTEQQLAIDELIARMNPILEQGKEREGTIEKTRSLIEELKGKLEKREENKEKVLLLADKFKGELSSSHLVTLESLYSGTLEKLFTKQSAEGKKEVDFSGNESADIDIGLGDILSWEEKYVEVWKPGESTPRKGIRVSSNGKNGIRPAYIDINTKEYIEIHTGYVYKSYKDPKASSSEDFGPDLPSTWMHESNVLQANEEMRDVLIQDETSDQIAREARSKYLAESDSKVDRIIASFEAPNISNQEYTKQILELSSREVWEMRKKYGPDALKAKFKEKGIYEANLTPENIDNSLKQAIAKVCGDFSDEQKLAIYQRMRAISKQESESGRNHIQFAVSPTGALGPFQIVKDNYTRFDINPFDLNESAYGAVMVLREEYNRSTEQSFEEKLNFATMAYFAGAGGAKTPDQKPAGNSINPLQYLTGVKNKESKLSREDVDWNKEAERRVTNEQGIDIHKFKTTSEKKNAIDSLFESTRQQAEKLFPEQEKKGPLNMYGLTRIDKMPEYISYESATTTPYVNTAVARDLITLAIIYKTMTGRPLRITSSYRSIERQREIQAERIKKHGSIKDKNGKTMVATPGYSMHNVGVAVDISSNSYTNGKIGNDGFQYMAAKCGFAPLSYEAWHYEHIPTKSIIEARGGVNNRLRVAQKIFNNTGVQ